MGRDVKSPDLGLSSAVLTWAVVSGIGFYIAWQNASRYGEVLPWAALLALVNLAAMVFVARCDADRRPYKRLALGLQLLSAFGIGLLLHFDFVLIYTIVWIAMAGSVFAFATAAWILVGILITWYAIEAAAWGETDALLSIALYGTFHLFALLSARAAEDARIAREKAEALNRELVATQHLLSEASRQHERTRIARDLHDLLGHHLTALSLNLQIAERLSDGEVREKVAESRALARLLLADVRDAVSSLRDGGIDFREAMRLLVENVPELDVRLDIEDGLAIDDVEVAESLLRCVQEAVTNTLRHSGAKTIWVRIGRDGQNLRLELHDDGTVSGPLREGNGLSGMRERLQRLKGSLTLDTAGDALKLTVEIPVT